MAKKYSSAPVVSKDTLSTDRLENSAQNISDVGGFTTRLSKQVQGISYVNSSKQLVVEVYYQNAAGYDHISNIIDEKHKPKKEYKENHIILKYSNWKSRLSSNKTINLVFASGYIKPITLLVPGINSQIKGNLSETISYMSSSPYENLLALTEPNVKHLRFSLSPFLV